MDFVFLLHISINLFFTSNNNNKKQTMKYKTRAGKYQFNCKISNALSLSSTDDSVMGNIFFFFLLDSLYNKKRFSFFFQEKTYTQTKMAARNIVAAFVDAVAVTTPHKNNHLTLLTLLSHDNTLRILFLFSIEIKKKKNVTGSLCV